MLTMRRAVVVFSLLAVIAAVVWLAQLMQSTRPPSPLDGELQRVVSDLVLRDHSVKNCVASVIKGDGSFMWSGAAGVANEHVQAPMTRDTPIYIASVTKLYTATAVMLLMERGALSLDDTMAKYLPQDLIHGIHVYNGKDYSAEITIRELLSHSSGIPDYYTEKSVDGKSLFDLFREAPGRRWTVDETIERARDDLKPRFPPGSDVSYSDTNFQLLGKVIEAVSGKPLEAVYDEFLFRPLGLEHTWLVGNWRSTNVPAPAPADVFYGDVNITQCRSNGAFWADGGIVSTAEEMNRFLIALNRGRIIRPVSLKLMHNWRRLRFPLQYGFGTMRFNLPRPIRAVVRIPPLWGHSGSTGSFLYYLEDFDLYMGGTIDQTESKIKPFLLMGKIIRAIAAENTRLNTRNR